MRPLSVQHFIRWNIYSLCRLFLAIIICCIFYPTYYVEWLKVFFHIILPRTFHEFYIRRTWFLHENSISFSWILHIVYTLSAYFLHIHMFNIFSPRCSHKISMKNTRIFHKVYIEYLWFFHNFLHKKKGKLSRVSPWD